MISSYEQAVNEAVRSARLVNSYAGIANFFPAVYWLSELYQHMVTRGEITELKMLESSRKLVIWVAVCEAIPGKARGMKVMASQAAYMWELITESGQS